ncbi:hypothetical protein KRR26_26535 [Corallococcus sp. M34]|uniref:hypothetical protein n=1 Tax=Citreicoccus inhibens TaxID=2849499 RepID=UPI001C22BBD1|nr:hypothetical protein [Citreicoccus inhibens]MBU8899177.1 hypothetical protein [Citreicoccus inhibens]
MIRLFSLLALCSALVLLVPLGASAQLQAPTRLQEVDPDAEDASPPDDSQEQDDSEREAEEPPARSRPGKGKAAEVVAPPPVAPVVAPAPAAPPPPPRPALTPVLAPKVTDADLLAVWDRWRQARSRNDNATAEAALKELAQLKDEVLALGLEPLSVGLAREAAVRRRAGDVTGALRLLDLAVELSPRLPSVRFARAETYVAADPLSAGRWGGELREAWVALALDARYRRPALADLGALGLMAWAATAMVVVAVLILRRLRYALHDFHHLLPRVVSRWQSTVLGVLLLSLPLVLGWGVLPVLLIGFAVVSLYLSVAERAVAAVLLAGLGVLPLAAGGLVRVTAFAGTVAEDVYVLERGGVSAQDAAERVRERLGQRKATFAEAESLAWYESRRGLLEDARTHFKAASALRGGDARMLIRFGNTLMGLGDTEGAVQLYTQAAGADATLAAPHYNLAQIHRRRARALPDEQVGAELDRAATESAAAQALDGSLLRREPPPDERPLVNLLMLAPAMPDSEWLGLADGSRDADRVEAQVGRWLASGVAPGPVAWALPAVCALLAVAFGAAAGPLKAARVCERCGRPVCTRCDRELGQGSKQCGQCVNVFSRRGLVPKELRARKEDQVERHRTWGSRAAYVLGALVSGAGHVFTGRPVRGALYAFAFLFAVAVLVLRQGLVRVPYGDAPLYLKLGPAVLLLLLIYLLSLRGLSRLQRGEA